eukprot:1148902-Pelagomonas_calceolata.AAC.3
MESARVSTDQLEIWAVGYQCKPTQTHVPSKTGGQEKVGEETVVVAKPGDGVAWDGWMMMPQNGER